MKVKQLKQILNMMNEDFDVVVCDIDDKGIAIMGAITTPPVVKLETRQSFPDEWYDESGEEIDGRRYELRPNEEIEDDFDIPVEGSDYSLSVRLKVHDGYAEAPGVRMEYPKLSELTAKQIEEMDDYLGGRISDSGYVLPDDVLLMYGRVVSIDIPMATCNGHDAGLVKEINEAWLEDRKRFEWIMKALYARDIDEITDSDAFQFAEWRSWPEYRQGLASNEWDAYNQRALKEMSKDWDKFAQNYLMHIADDGDLLAILHFVN